MPIGTESDPLKRMFLFRRQAPFVSQIVRYRKSTSPREALIKCCLSTASGDRVEPV